MNQVRRYIHGEVCANGSGIRLQWICGTDHLAHFRNRFHSLKHDPDNRRVLHEFFQICEEGFFCEVRVVDVELIVGKLEQLESDDLESLALKACKNFSEEVALKRVGFQKNEGALYICHMILMRCDRRGGFYARPLVRDAK